MKTPAPRSVTAVALLLLVCSGAAAQQNKGTRLELMDIFKLEFASDPQFLKDLERRGYRYVAPRPALRDGDRAFGGAGPWITNGEGQEPVARVARSGDESLRSFEQRRREIGLDHFEVRTYRSLLRHLALSTASLLFLEERARRLGSRKDRPSIKSRAL